MRRSSLAISIAVVVLSAAFTAVGCSIGPAATGSFDRTLSVSGPIRVELNGAAGDVTISGGSGGKVHIHAEARASGFGLDSPEKRINEIVNNPPIEQHGDVVRIGQDLRHFRGVSISYVIEVPHDTEVSSNVVSGSQVIRNLKGPLKVDSVAGSINVDHIDRQTQLSIHSGSIFASDINDDLRANSSSGSVIASNIKGDVRISAVFGPTQIKKPGGRVEASSASGTVEVEGASKDVRAHAVSGEVVVQGNPGSNSYWDLKTTSGSVQLGVPKNANFHLTADAVSGAIKADIPIVIEEQDKHSLRAHIGNGGGRVEVRTVNGEIRVRAS
jgi:DUF4097 and DUF4098 domain-containing protein YvlB